MPERIEAEAACLRRAVEDFVLAFEQSSFPGATLIVKDLRDVLDDTTAGERLIARNDALHGQVSKLQTEVRQHKANAEAWHGLYRAELERQGAAAQPSTGGQEVRG